MHTLKNVSKHKVGKADTTKVLQQKPEVVGP